MGDDRGPCASEGGYKEVKTAEHLEGNNASATPDRGFYGASERRMPGGQGQSDEKGEAAGKEKWPNTEAASTRLDVIQMVRMISFSGNLAYHRHQISVNLAEYNNHNIHIETLGFQTSPPEIRGDHGSEGLQQAPTGTQGSPGPWLPLHHTGVSRTLRSVKPDYSGGFFLFSEETNSIALHPSLPRLLTLLFL